MGGFNFLLVCFDVIGVGRCWFWQLPTPACRILAPCSVGVLWLIPTLLSAGTTRYSIVPLQS